MDKNTFVIFAELSRDKFEDILDRLMKYYPSIQFGRQGDDWIWVHLEDDKVEIDSFTSKQLEVKGRQKQAKTVQHILKVIEKEWILKRFDPPKEDLTR
ncbi:MAG: hypothetical protein HYU84_17365 [Chloroflexi bacterium]|nr:hypothetical protein [Chloroflexota bacterium]MBI3170367.1 hypothetical protein [Chloroflexota bacterium]